MSQLVLKFGGTSLATPDHVQKAADLVAAAYHDGHDIAVVVSAMAGQTQDLIALTQSLSYAPPPREYDVVLSTGEQVTCGLMAIALHKRGVPAQSLLSWQLPLITDGFHSQAHIKEISCAPLRKIFQQRQVGVVPGFQGINSQGDLTTIGRGGSDVTAIALAASLEAEECLIYTDVPGIFTADPHLVPTAFPLKEISRKCLITLAQLGAKVIHTRAAFLAEKYHVPFRVLSTFQPEAGTIVNGGNVMETPAPKSVVLEEDVCVVRFEQFQPDEDLLNALLSLLTEYRFSFDPLTQDQQKMISFVIPTAESQRFEHLCSRHALLGKHAYTKTMSLGKISLVGVGLHHGALDVTQLLKNHAIKLQGVFLNETRLSLLVDKAYSELTLRLLHDTFIFPSKNHTEKVASHA